ncbi:MAG TPA: TonB-dependent receptor [Polyangia bacterium]|nr:TonB-dependent receptor [Polyangia bacterium]
MRQPSRTIRPVVFPAIRPVILAVTLTLGLAVWSSPTGVRAQTGDDEASDAQAAAGEPASGDTPKAEASAASPSETSLEASDESHATSSVASFAATRLKDSPAVVTVISGDDIRSTGARDLIDILYLVPGYFMGVDTEGVVGPGFRGMWGHEGKILLMIDGKEMNELLFSNMQLGNEFPVELIERVEVVRGPGSVIYGGSAELSVINVVTRGVQGATDGMVALTYGQMTGAARFGDGYGRRKMTASGRLVLDSVPGLSGFASLSLGQGQRSVRNFVDNAGTVGPMEGQSALNPAVVQAGIGFRNIQASFLYHHLAMTSISGAGATVTSDDGNGGTVIGPPLPVYFDSFASELVAAFRPTNRFEIVPRFNYTYQRPWHAPNQDGYFYDKSVQRARARLLGRWAPIDELQLTVGGDSIFDSAKVLGPDTVGVETLFGNSTSISYQTYGAYAELFSENPIVNVAAGVRYDHLGSGGNAMPSFAASALVPRFVLQRSFGALTLKGLYSQSFRAPGVENINAGRDPTNPGRDLQPERTRIFEFDATVDLTSQQRLSANVFDCAIDAPIAYSFDPVLNIERYQNLGRQGTRGFEVSYRLRATVARLEANYSFYRPTVADNTPTYDVPGHPQQFLGAPAHHASVRATFRPIEGFGISPTAIFLGPTFSRGPDDGASNETAVELPARLLANLFIYRDNVGVKGLTVGLGIYNIFGADFRYVHASTATSYSGDHAPLPGLDREVLLRITYLGDGGGGEPASYASAR